MNTIKIANRLYIDADDLNLILSEAQLRSMKNTKTPKSEDKTLANVILIIKEIKKTYDQDTSFEQGEVQELILTEAQLEKLI